MLRSSSMKRTVLVVVVFSLLSVGAAVAQPPAGQCVIGPGMGSTVLYPYFEVVTTPRA